MREVSAQLSAVATHEPLAGRKPQVADSQALKGAAFGAAIAAKLDRIRALMVQASPKGFRTGVAERMAWRVERISRELSGVEKLSVALFLAQVRLHREQGRHETADRLIAAVNEGEPIRLAVGGALVIRLADGQLALNFE